MKKRIYKFVSIAVIVVAALFIWNLDASAVKDRNGKALSVDEDGNYCCLMTTNTFNNCTSVPDCTL